MSSASFTIDPLLELSIDQVAVLGGEGVEIEGVIRVTNGQAVAVRGHVTGRIESDGCVIIGENGVLHGSVTAKSLQMDGAIHRVTDQDLVKVSGPLVLGAKAQLFCDAESSGLQMTYGAVIHGSLRPNGAEPLAAKTEAPAPVVRAAEPVAAPESASVATAAAEAMPISMAVPDGDGEGADQFRRPSWGRAEG